MTEAELIAFERNRFALSSIFFYKLTSILWPARHDVVRCGCGTHAYIMSIFERDDNNRDLAASAPAAVYQPFMRLPGRFVDRTSKNFFWRFISRSVSTKTPRSIPMLRVSSGGITRRLIVTPFAMLPDTPYVHLFMRVLGAYVWRGAPSCKEQPPKKLRSAMIRT